MGIVQVRFKAADGNNTDLESTLILNNKSDRWNDEIVAQDLRNFLAAYRIFFIHPKMPLQGECVERQEFRRSMNRWIRSISILPPVNGRIYRIEARPDAVRAVSEAYHFSSVNDTEVKLESEEGNYFVYMRPAYPGMVSK